MQGPQLGNVIFVPSSPVVCTALSVITEARHQGGNFHLSFSWCPVIKVCGIFRNTVLPLNSGVWWGATTTACIEFGTFGASMPNNQRCSTPGPGIFLYQSILSGKSMKYSYRLPLRIVLLLFLLLFIIKISFWYFLIVAYKVLVFHIWSFLLSFE